MLLKAPLKLASLTAWILLCIPPVWLATKLKKAAFADRLIRLCYAGNLRIVGLRVQAEGAPESGGPLLLVSNHVSYLDVLVLGSQGAIRFTPKDDIASWPLIGGICRLTRCIFIDRRPEKFAEAKETVRQSLARNNTVCIFPESTTGDGIHMLPFKSALFSLAEEGLDGGELKVQPTAITYTHIHRLPIDSTQWPHIAWYGDMRLLPHLLNMLRIGPVTARVKFLQPVTIGQCGDRKRMAEHCQRAIGEAINDTRRQRQPVPKKEPFRPARWLQKYLKKNN